MGSRRLILALVLLIAPLAAPVGAQAPSEPALWRFADPHPKSLIGMDWARIRNSAAGAAVRQKLPPPGTVPGLLLLDLLDSIDRVLISSPAAPAAVNSGADSENSSVLIAIQGHFDAARVRQFFALSGAKPQSYNSFQVYRPQAKTDRDSAYVLFDAHTVLYGDAPLVFAALDRNEFGPPVGPAPGPGSLVARAAELDAKYELWGILDVAEVTSPETFGALFHGDEWASAIQGLEAGVNVGAGLDADFILHLASEEAAKHVTADLANAVNTTGKDNGIGVPIQGIAKKLRFSVEGSAAKVSLHMNQQELQEVAQAFQAGVQAGKRTATTNSGEQPGLAPASAAPPKPAVIRIEGLDEGTREIPYQQPPK